VRNAKSPVNNAIYDELGERWHTAQDDPVALVRAEARLRTPWVTVVLPRECGGSAGRISVLAPLGAALLGYRAGDEVEWLMPGGLRRLRIESVHPPAENMEAPGHEVVSRAVG
jgi:hypothetical protein